MRRRIIGVVFKRELRDVLRDRRTLFTMLVLPLILYPTMMLGFSKLTLNQAAALQRQRFEVMVRAGDEVLRSGSSQDKNPLAQALLDVPEFIFVDVPDPKERALRIDAGDLGFFLQIPERLDAKVHAAQRSNAVVTLTPHYESTNERSRTAYSKLESVVRSHRQAQYPLVLSDTKDQATAGKRGGFRFGPLLAMLVVMMAMTGAFYPALDVAAGEKERGTLETLLLSPASRRELVVGKYLTVLTIALVAALANLGSMTLTFGGFASMLGSSGGMEFSLDLRAFFIILLGLVLLAGLFSAVCLAISTFSQSYKEGQAYMTPALILVMFLAMVALLPNTQLDMGTAFIPVTNVALLMKGLLVERLPVDAALVSMAVVAGLALIALLWAASLFEREEVLFQEGKQVFGLRPPPGRPKSRSPSAGLAVLGILLALAWLYYASVLFASHGLLLTQVALFLGLAVLALLLPAYAMVDLRAGLALRWPKNVWLALGGVVLGVALTGVSLGIGVHQRRWLGDPSEGTLLQLEKLEELLRSLDIASRILILAVLPGLAEELLFRGLVLRGLFSSLGARGAVAMSALAFALYHMSLHRFFPQLTVGLFLGFLAVRTRSIWPAVLAHVVHNGLLVSERAPEGTWWVIVGVVVAGGLLVIIHRAGPTGPRGLEDDP